jgi:hypothetical protein
MGIDELRVSTQVGPFAMIDFIMSYLAALVIWIIINLFTSTWSGILLVKLLLGVIPLSIFTHLFAHSGKKLDPVNTKRTSLTDMFTSPNLCSFSSVAAKLVVVGSMIAMGNI